jgi:predicted outer membrane repeat protein
MVATSLLATSALLGTYLGNPRLGRAYATGVCTAATENEFKIEIAKASCTTINITASFTAISAETIASDDTRHSLTINGVGNGITINGGVTTEFRLLDNKKAGLSLTISNLTIRNFKFAGDGGAIFSAGAVTVTNSTFNGNNADVEGGAIYSEGTVTVTNSTFSGNTSDENGGAINSEGTVSVTDSTFSDNASHDSGGAVRASGSVTVTNSTFSENLATVSENTSNVFGVYGGAIHSSLDVTVTNSTFYKNRAVMQSPTPHHDGGNSHGGAIKSFHFIAINSTFSENSSTTTATSRSSRGGAVYATEVSAYNSIFANNYAINAVASYSLSRGDSVNAVYESKLKNNIFSSDRATDIHSPIPNDTNNIFDENPNLDQLAENGGRTKTMLLKAGSPAINAGDNSLIPSGVTTDQRGFARIANGTVDMGAVEVEGSAGASSGWDGVGVQSLTSVLLQDQSGLDRIWSDHDILLQALKAVMAENPDSELKVLADGSVRLTAFIPTDRAFRKLAFDLTGVRPRNNKATFRVVNSLGIEKIEQILLYHVVLGDPINSEAALAANGVRLNTLSGDSFSLSVTTAPNIFLRDNNKDLKNPKVLLKRVDINSGNRQVAHVINRVLIPIEDLK